VALVSVTVSNHDEGAPGPSLLGTGDIDTMQARSSTRLPDTTTTLPHACLFSAAFGVPPHSTGKERDAESGNDYFGARYFGSSMGRFLSPDAFYHDSHVADPQSWNEYAYARNNPLRYTDPTGKNATATQSCNTDASGHQTCNVSVTATISIYAASFGISKDQLQAAASTMQNSIDSAWSGSFQKDGTTYNVSTQVTVSVSDSQDAAMKSGAQNVIGMVNGPTGPNEGAHVDPKSRPGQAQDTGMMDINHVDNYAPHEFTHLLGVDDKPGNVLSNTDPSQRPGSATRQDYMWGIQEAIGRGRWGFLDLPPSPARNYLRDAGRGGQFAGSVKTNKVFLLVADCAGRAP